MLLCGRSLDFSVRFDAQSLCVFVGDYSGQIAVLKISRTSFELLTVLKGHTGIADFLVPLLLCYILLFFSVILRIILNTSFESPHLAPHTWNSLPSDIGSCRTVDIFKRQLKTVLTWCHQRLCIFGLYCAIEIMIIIIIYKVIQI